MKREAWSAHARADFDRQVAFVAERSPAAAKRLSDAILSATAGLRQSNTGRIGRIEGTFEQVVRKQPYIILFEMTDEEVRILRVVHSARDWPEGQMPPP
ncbi:MAG TPA: type II toxin-antitoxin system RelE/ParE family toxin [Hyphomonadaceae bacterium]|nr:type II toxin-antitoxin system RelE/ParE family toxin [Hyphomonadaceae bacterium]